MTKLAAGNTSTQAVITDTDLVVLVKISKVILPFSHSSDEDTYAFFGLEGLDIILDTNYWAFETQCHLSAIRREVISYWILDDAKQRLI